MQLVKTNWVKKTLGTCLAFSLSTLIYYSPLHTTAAQAHAEHGSEGGIPTVSPKAKLPKGLSLQVVKSNAYQFALATDGQQQVEILGEDQRAFLRFDGGKLYADLNATGWHRSRQPGGGPIPDRLKDNTELKPNWVLLDNEPGYGWYDPRLIKEDLAHFNLGLIANGKPLSVRIERVEEQAMTGYWRPFLDNEPSFSGLNAMVPGLSGNALMLTRLGSAQGEYQVLDEQDKAFMELRSDGIWLDSMHPWATKVELFHAPGTAESPWVKVSSAGTVTYADPRLNSKPSRTSQVGRWQVPIQLKGEADKNVLQGKLKWQRLEDTQ